MLQNLIKVLYIVFVLVLAVATFVEWKMGTPFVSRYFYGSAWFVVIAGALVALSVYFFAKRLRNNIPAFLAHSALAVIALGALITHLTSVKGTLHLRVHHPQCQFVSSDGLVMDLPSAVTLQSFTVSNYPGTDTPMDFVSRISVDGCDSATVSMNNVVSVGGYRLYQSSFDYDRQGSVFMVNYDPVGIPVTYFGYFLLFASLVSVLLNPRGKFRNLVRNLSAAGVAAVVLSSCGNQSPLADQLRYPTPEQAREFSKVCVFYHDRIVPLNTYATDFCLKITGKPRYKGLTAEQFMLGWLLYPEQWQYENVIRVKNPLPQGCGVDVVDGYTSVAGLYGPDNRCRLISRGGAKPTKGEIEVSDKLRLIISLTEGSALRIFPYESCGTVSWLSSADDVPDSASGGLGRMMGEWVRMARMAADSADAGVWNLIALQLARYQMQVCGDHLPSPAIRRIEIAYNRIRPTTWLFRLQLTFGIVLLILSIRQALGNCRFNIGGIQLTVAASFFGLQLTSLIFRGIISGTVPVSNGYETMLFLALSILGIVFFVNRIQPMLGSLCVLLSGFSLLVADIAISNPHITPLMPVLHSPWLSVHVMSVMISYSLFTVIALNAAVCLLAARHGGEARMRRFCDISLVLLYPAVVLLAVGIFIGAIWANESWGTYWSWDPKEVWALITLLVYAVPLHGGLLPGLQSPRAMSIYLLLAFATVLMTYFGVNYLLGGMHSYAG